MHQLTFARISAFVAVLGLTLTTASAQSPVVVSVLYAGSLVTPMEGPVKVELSRLGVEFQGETGGSTKLANFILAGVRNLDVFISVDRSLVAKLGTRVAMSTTFATTTLGIAWSPRSRQAALFERVATGAEPLEAALATPGISLGRTDPRLDPKGKYTIASMNAWLGAARAHAILGDDENPAQIFPEEDLLARLETGQVDVGFFYKTEAVARGFPFVELPPAAAAAARIEYTLAVMSAAPHPEAAYTFSDFILHGKGRAILEKSGLTYLSPPDSR